MFKENEFSKKVNRLLDISLVELQEYHLGIYILVSQLLMFDYFKFI